MLAHIRVTIKTNPPDSIFTTTLGVIFFVAF